ncbi:MAG: VWA domain-containing protein [Acidobacteria bacterium]|nr:VWA domain-containing protein [Acidobacteriota bacterium]
MRRLLVLLCMLPLLAAPPKTGRARFRIPVWVKSRTGESVAPVTAKDLTATLQGSSSRVLSVSPPGDALITLLVLDLTEGLTRAETAKEALIGETGQLPETAWVGLLRAQDGLKVILDPTKDRTAVADAVRAAPVSGKAGLLDTVETMEGIADAILTKAAVRLAVFYVTDSSVENYREDLTNPVINSSDPHDLSRRFPEQLVQERIAKLQKSLARRQTPLFIVHLIYRSDRMNEAYQNGLKQLAETTGGTSLFCRSVAEIPEAIKKTFETITSYQSVCLELPARLPESAEVQLLLTGNDNEDRILSYRTRFTVGRE